MHGLEFPHLDVSAASGPDTLLITLGALVGLGMSGGVLAHRTAPRPPAHCAGSLPSLQQPQGASR